MESLRGALEAAKKAKRRLFEKLADREIEREVFLERKKGYDVEIGRLEQEILERFVKGACVYPDGRIEVRWNFGDENE